MKSFIAGCIVAMLAVLCVAGVLAVYYAGNQQIISTATTGTAPFSVASTTMVNNLNAGYLDGYSGETFMPATCYPQEQSALNSGTTFSTVYSCTGCSGWLQIIRIRSSVSGLNFRGEARVTIDGNQSTWENTDMFGSPQDAGFAVLSRFNNNLTLEIRRSGGSAANIHGVFDFCLET